MMTTFSHRVRSGFAATLFVLALVAGTAGNAEAEGPCAAPGTGLPGALNMLHDPTMWDTMDIHTSPQGDDGMFRAVGVSGC